MSALINVLGPALAAFIVWWFWLSRPHAQASGGMPVTVLVEDGVYIPARIEARAGQPLVLRFLRKDSNPCAEKVIFDQLQLTAELPIGQPYDVRLTPPAPGEYVFTCEMHMYRGSVVAK